MNPEPPGAGRYTSYAGGGDDQVVSMSPRRNVPAPSAYNVYAAELPPKERERLRLLELPRVQANQDLPRFQCRYFERCKYAFTTEALKIDHEAGCLDQQKIADQHFGEKKASGVSREEVVSIVKDAIGELVKALNTGGVTKAKKKRGRPRNGSSQAHRREVEEVRSTPDPEVGSADGSVEGSSEEPT